METFLAGYIGCMVWLTLDANGEPDTDATWEKIAPSAMATITAECAAFEREHKATWQAGGWTDGQAGHDFYLTRNGHGAGFWDRSFTEDNAAGQVLTAACKAMGEQELYRGDDGLYYV